MARAHLESLLRARKLDGTVINHAAARSGDYPVVPTGIPVLDAELDGGLPRGHLSEIVGAASSGRTGLLCALLAAATERGELVALVDTLDTFDPRSAATAGLDLSRLLWVRGWGSARPVGVDRMLKALNLILQAGEFDVVGLDLVDVPLRELSRIPFTTWMRLHRVIEGSKTACILVGTVPIARSSAGLTIATRSVRSGGCWEGRDDGDRKSVV